MTSSLIKTDFFVVTILAVFACLSSQTLHAQDLYPRKEIELFVAENKIKSRFGILYEIISGSSTVGWLYGGMHIGTRHYPSISRDAVDAVFKSSSLYIEATNSAGDEIDASDYVAYFYNKNKTGFSNKEMAALAEKALCSVGKTDFEHLTISDYINSKEVSNFVESSYDYCGISPLFSTETFAAKIMSKKNGGVRALETQTTRINSTEKLGLGAEPSNHVGENECGRYEELDVSIERVCELNFLDQTKILSMKYSDMYKDYIVTEGFNSLFSRNKAMSLAIVDAINAKQKPFIAVGITHVLGPIGIQEMLSEKGFKIRKIGN